MTMEEKQKLLDKVKLDMEAKAGELPLTKVARDIVPAEGNPNAEIMFIGEAAGYHESVERRPFVGVAGKLLTENLLANGIRREEVWISNILKTRPPNNRDPLPAEIEAFKPFLDWEIEIIRPKIIVTLGRFSMYKFLGEEVRIGQVHGQARWVNLRAREAPIIANAELNSAINNVSRMDKPQQDRILKVVVLPMYHPAAALRSSNVKRMFEEDFKKLPKILAKIKGEDDKIEVTQEKEEQLKLI